MVRPAHLPYPPRVPVSLRAAASIILLRNTDDREGGLEVLMTRRSASSSFEPGMFVFPGGGVAPADGSADAHGIAAQRPGQNDVRLTQAITAIRECFEELGILLAYGADGQPVTPREIALLDRAACASSASAFIQQCTTLGLVLAADQLHVLAHWITSRDQPRRFDIPFLVARMPHGQQASAGKRTGNQEDPSPIWITPARAIARHDAGQMSIMFPSLRTLQWLALHKTADSVLRACQHESPLWVSCPRVGLLHGRETRYMEHEPPFGELALVCPDGQIAHELGWQNGAPVTLLKNLRRCTQTDSTLNPASRQGINSYIIGTPASGFIVIDPGPADAAHIDRIVRATDADVRAIVCTHPTFAQAAPLLQAACTRRTKQAIPVLGIRMRPNADPAPSSQEMADGERLRIEGFGVSHTLRAVHVSGHLGKRLCLLFEEEGLLFTGGLISANHDTEASGTPPTSHASENNVNEDMDDYYQSLDQLKSLCEQCSISTLLPAHGHAIGPAASAIAARLRSRTVTAVSSL